MDLSDFLLLYVMSVILAFMIFLSIMVSWFFLTLIPPLILIILDILKDIY